MGFLDKFKALLRPRPSALRAAGGSDPFEIVKDARARARRRLIGAAILLVVGIVGFPLLFESQPRPIPVDIPIDIPSRDAAVPLMPAGQRLPRPDPSLKAPPVEAPAVMPAEPGTAAAASSPTSSASATPAARQSAAPSSPAARSAEPAAAARPAVALPSKPAVSVPAKPAASAASAKAVPAKPVEPRSTEPKSVDSKATDTPADDGRFVVQIGAFAEVASAREARMKVEALGLKTYTQVIESATGRRIRVRVGPYSTKAEAEKAAARIKASGLQAAVLVL